MFGTAGGNAVLEALRGTPFDIDTLYGSVHTGAPGLTGANEMAGTPRQLIALDAAASKATQNTAQEEWTLGATGQVVALGLWSADVGGTFLGYGWLGGHVQRPFTAAVDDVITAPGHGYADGQRVVFTDDPGGALPTGLAEDTLYYVRDSATNTFKVATTAGGVAVDLTTVGSGMVRRVEPRDVLAGDLLRVPAGSLDLALV